VGGEREGAFFAPPSYWLYYPIPLLPLLWGYEFQEFCFSFATVDSEGDLRGEVTAITDNYSPLSSPFLFRELLVVSLVVYLLLLCYGYVVRGNRTPALPVPRQWGSLVPGR